MSAPISLLPALTGSSFPAPAVFGLSDDEQRFVTGLSNKLLVQSFHTRTRWTYYDGLQQLQNLGVSVPPQLAGVRTVVDWPRICVDPLVRACVVDGFRLRTATDVDSELMEHWVANNMDAEFPMCALDSLVAGRGYVIVGTPDVTGDSPVVTIESPLNLAMVWDPRTRRVTAAYQAYEAEGVYRAVLYLPGVTIPMSKDTLTAQWLIEDRDEHGFDTVPVVRLPNRSRTHDREGRSEITAAIMNTTDSTVRSLLGMEIAREFYSIPHRYVLGADESDFQDAAGNPKTALDMAMNKFLAFERGADGQAPTVGQFQAFDPSVFTKIIDEHAQLMASYTGFPPAYFGQTTTANPASADAIRTAENGLVGRARQVQQQFSGPLQDVMKLVWRFANGGADLPDEMRRLETDWTDPATPTPAATADAMFKQAQMGAVPPTSDVVLKALGWNGVDRARLEVDRKLDAGASVLAELANSLQAKQARTDTTVIRDINPAAAKAQPGDSTNNPPTGTTGQ